MKNRVELKKISIFFIIIVCGIFLYYGAKSTYTSYESNVDGKVAGDIAGIKIAINGEDIAANSDTGVVLDNLSWSVSHTREGKISPGSTGTVSFTLDPAGSEVAFMYQFELIDKQANQDKLLTLSDFNTDNSSLIRTGESTYTGVITLDDIAQSKVVTVSFNFTFDDVDTEAITEDTGDLDDFFTINFYAIQYNGETIVPYSG